MNYEIVFTKGDPPEPRIVIGKDKMTVFAKGDENSEADFLALQRILEGASYKEFVMDNELIEMEKKVAEELVRAIDELIDIDSTVGNMQPPLSVVQAMAKAATMVLIAFERGYRMA